MELLLSLCRYVTAVVFLLAAVSKVTKLKSFRSNLSESFHLPVWSTIFIAFIIIFIEFSLAVWLLVWSDSTKLAMLMALMLMLVFCAVLAAVYWYKGPVRCNCFGEQHRTFSSSDLARNLLITCATCFYLIMPEFDVRQSMSLPLLTAAVLISVVLIHLHEVVELLSIRGEYD